MSGTIGLSDKTPYVIGLVQLFCGEVVIGQLTSVDLEHLYVGMVFQGRIRRLFVVPYDQVIVYGVKFQPSE
jgi:uncharacterized OB-fold protein